MNNNHLIDFAFEDFLNLGLIQTTVDKKLAWNDSNPSPKMSDQQDEFVWQQLCMALKEFNDSNSINGKPNIILAPELVLPSTRIQDYSRLIGRMNVISVIGVDYTINGKSVKNQGLIFVPSNFDKDYPSKYTSIIRFGKSFPAPSEKEGLKNKGYNFVSDPNVYLLDCGIFGKIGLSICYDFMDLERALMYKNKVQHIFVLAYNRDIEIFRSIATTLSRTVFCNVVICNTGFYGGSFCIAPKNQPHERIIYAHKGQKLYTTQVLRLAVKGLINQQQDNNSPKKNGWKNTPPGFKLDSKI